MGTVDEKGHANIHPTWCYYDPLKEKIYIMTGKQSKKLENLANNKIIYFCIDDPTSPFKGVRGKGIVKTREDRMVVLDCYFYWNFSSCFTFEKKF
jgi:general stress protein 26